MIKPDSLRAALTAAIPDLRTDPKRLKMFIDKGSLRATAVPGLAFEYRYKLQLILLDFVGHPDQVMVPLLAWLFVNQNDLLANPDKQRDGISFDAELLDDARVDMVIELALTERVTVARRSDGGYDITHHAEPPIEPSYGPPVDGFNPDGTPGPDTHLWHLWLGTTQLLEWTAPGIITEYP